MDVAGWRVWYTDERVFASDATDWRALPDDGVLVFVIYYDAFSGGDGSVRRRQILSGEDWYFHVPDSDLYGANSDPLDENEARYPDAVYKRGKWTDAATFERVREQARDSTWP